MSSLIRQPTPVLLARSAALFAAAALALTACSTPETDTTAAPTADTSVTAEQTTAAPEASAETTAPVGDATPIPIGTEFTDAETGDVVTIVSAVRGNATEYYEATDDPNGEMIYLEVAVTPGEQFGGTISAADFYLLSGGEEVNYAASASDELEAAGYTYFDSASRRDGAHTGFIPIYVSETAATLPGAYIRPEAKILGEDTTIPEFRGDFELPAA